MRHRRFKGRNIHGIVVLDKPLGISSSNALNEVKGLFKARKAGHTGSLDPLASGMLVVCFGEATKISAFLLDADKHYRTTFKLGVKTTTGDAEGEVVERRPVGSISADQLERVLSDFRGEISQIPPMYSALKHKGQPLYKLAREGKEVERQPRNVRIYELSLLAQREDEIELDIQCSKGTYIRTLAEDIGEVLGCGGYVSQLSRTGLGPYQEAQMVTMDQLKQAASEGQSALEQLMLPVESALSRWPDVQLTEDTAYYLRQGQPVLVPHAPTEGWVRLYSGQGSFMGIGEILDDGRVAPRRLLNVA